MWWLFNHLSYCKGESSRGNLQEKHFHSICGICGVYMKKKKSVVFVLFFLCLSPPSISPSPESQSPSTSTSSWSEQGLICCFISHLACLILYQAGPLDSSVRCARYTKCYANVSAAREKWRAHLSRQTCPSFALHLASKEQTIFLNLGCEKMSFCAIQKQISNKVL